MAVTKVVDTKLEVKRGSCNMEGGSSLFQKGKMAQKLG